VGGGGSAKTWSASKQNASASRVGRVVFSQAPSSLRRLWLPTTLLTPAELGKLLGVDVRDRGRKLDDGIERGRNAVHELAEVRQRGDDRVRKSYSLHGSDRDIGFVIPDLIRSMSNLTYLNIGTERTSSRVMTTSDAMSDVHTSRRLLEQNCKRRMNWNRTGITAWFQFIRRLQFCSSSLREVCTSLMASEVVAETARAELQAPYELEPGCDPGPVENALGRDVVEDSDRGTLRASDPGSSTSSSCSTPNPSPKSHRRFRLLEQNCKRRMNWNQAVIPVRSRMLSVAMSSR
jgi:hypothetical protein